MNSLIHGNGRWVATGPSGLAAQELGSISTDGVTWQTIAGALPFSGRAIFAKGKFFSPLSEGGKIVTSTDGVTWTRVTLPGVVGPIQALALAEGDVVAVGMGGTARSSDGITWTASANNLPTFPQQLAFANGVYVVAGPNRVYRSLDGISWVGIEPEPGVSPQVRAIASNGTLFVLAAMGSGLQTSPDGLNWTNRTLPNFLHGIEFTDAIFAESRFIVTSTVGFFSSSDGVSWRLSQFQTSVPAGRIGYGNGRFVYAAFPTLLHSVPDPDTITLQQDLAGLQSVSVGQAITLSVTAQSSTAVSYQWLRDGVAIPGATSSSLAIASAQAGDGGLYTVRITNVAGSAMLSSPARVVVDPTAPAITAGPASRTINVGTSVTLSVTGTGNPAPVVLWRKSGQIIAGATGSTLNLPNVSTADAGSYTATLTNAFGSATSAAAILTVAPLTIATNVAPVVGGSVVLTVDAAPSASYQWRYKGVPVAGATQATLTLTALSRAMNGFYDVVLTYPEGSVVPPAYAIDVAPAAPIQFYEPAPGYAPRFEREGQGTILAVLRLPDGKYLVGGEFVSLDGRPYSYLARFTAAGELDTSFVPPELDAPVRAIAAHPDGKVIIGGDFVVFAGTRVGRIARLNADLTPDTSFAAGTGCNGPVHVVLAQLDGSVMIAGAFSSVNGSDADRIARLDSSGAFDSGFAGSAAYGTGAARVLVPTPDGKWYFGGGTDPTVTTSGVGFFVRLNADGSRDESFFEQSFRPQGPIKAVWQQSDGKVVLGGRVTIGRLLADGTSDPTFTADASLTTQGQSVDALIPATAGGFYVAGAGIGLTRLTATGARDTTLPALPYASGQITTLASETGGDVRFWGAFRTAAGSPLRTGFGTLTSGNTLVAPGGAVPRIVAPIYSLHLVADGKILVRGGFTHFNGAARPGFLRLGADGALDTGFAPALTIPTEDTGPIVIQSDRKILIHDGTELVRLEADGARDTTFAAVPYAPAALALDRNGKALISNRASGGVFGSARGVRRLTSSGTVDTTFGSPVVAGDRVGHISPFNEGSSFWWGPYSSVNGLPTTIPTRASDTGEISWQSGVSSGAVPLAEFVNGDAFVPNGSSLILKGLSTFAQLSAAGGSAAILPLPDRRFVGVSVPVPESNPLFTRYSATGVADATFQVRGLERDAARVNRLLLVDDGSILVAGERLTAFRASRFGLMRLLPASAPSIAQAPVAFVGQPGGGGSFTVGATGSGVLSYQWFRNGVVIPGATSATLALANLTVADVALYSVRISNAYGSATSVPVGITGPNAAPTITMQPASQLTVSGSPARFTVAATGTGPLTYHWRRSGFVLPGANSATYSVPHASRGEAGNYDVVVADGLSLTVSQGVKLDVAPRAYLNSPRLDPNFALRLDAPGGRVTGIIPVGGGRFVVSGTFTRINGVDRAGLARVDANFQVDPTFVPPPGLERWATAFFFGTVVTTVHAVQPDGKLLITVPRAALGAYPWRNTVVRLLANGAVDPGFTASTEPENVAKLAVQPDGKIIVIGGYSSATLPAGKRYVYRLNADGSLDGTYAPVFSSALNLETPPPGVVVQSDGKAVYWGVARVNTTVVNRAVRLNANGEVDPTFTLTGFTGTLNTVARAADGGLLLGGSFQDTGGTNSALGRASADGAWQTAIGPASTITSVGGIITDENGKIWVAANSSPRLVWRLSGAGGVEQQYTLHDGEVFSGIALAGADRLLVSRGTAVDPVTGEAMRRYGANGAAENAVGLIDAAAGVTAFAFGPGGKIWVGGTFTRVGETAAGHIARLNGDGSLDSAFAPGAGFDGSVTDVLALPDGKVLVSGSHTRYRGLVVPALVRLHADGSRDESFNVAVGSSIAVPNGNLALLADGRVLVNGNLCYLSDGTRDTSYGATSASVQAIPLPDGDAVVIYGTAAARLRPDGTVRSSSTGSGFFSLTSLALQVDGKVLAGGAASATGRPFGMPSVRRLTTSFTNDTTWAATSLPMPDFATSAYRGPRLVAQEDGRVIVNDYHGMFRLNDGGTQDTAFSLPDITAMPQGVATNVRLLGVVRLADDGSWWVGDSDVGIDGFRRAGLFRFIDSALPVISAPPVDWAAVAGDTVTFQATVSGTGPFTYQWFKNGVAIAEATGATLTLSNVGVGDAGAYAVRVANAGGQVTSEAGLLAIAATIAPQILVQPRHQSVITGSNVVFAVAASGVPAPDFQWSKNGEPIPGATNARLSLSNIGAPDVGSYAVRVSNRAGAVTSTTATLSLIPQGVAATHAIAAPWQPGGTVTVTNTFSHSGPAPGMSWQALLPAGWSLATSAGDETANRPLVGTQDLLEWSWSTAPASPVNFSYTLNVPATVSPDLELVALVTVRPSGAPTQILARPDPLFLRHRHAADANRDGRLSLVELTRVIELFNTRNGTARTGCYAPASGSTEDGFTPDDSRSGSVSAALSRYHSGDSNRDGKLSLLELTRIIELYNYRNGTTRTGQYHVQAGTEDGFDPGP